MSKQIKFTVHPEGYEFGLDPELQAPWYVSNYGQMFVKASDLARVLGLTQGEAKDVYLGVVPELLQSGFMCRELAGMYLRSLVEIEPQARQLWDSIQDCFYSTVPSEKFEATIWPVKIDHELMAGVNLSELDRLGAVKLISGGALATFEFSKREHVIAACAGLTVNDSQVQYLITMLNNCPDDGHTRKTWAKVLGKADSLKLELTPLPQIQVRGTALKRDNAALEAEVERLTRLLQSNGISVDSTPQRSIKMDQASVDAIHAARDAGLQAMARLAEECFVAQVVQRDLLCEVSETLQALNVAHWSHERFVAMFNPERISLLIHAVHKQAMERKTTDLHTLTGLIEAQLGKCSEFQVVRDMIKVCSEAHAEGRQRVEAATRRAKASV